MTRLRLRSKSKEIDELTTSLMFLSGELDAAKKALGAKERTIRNLKRGIDVSKKRIATLSGERKKIEEKLVLLEVRRTREFEEKQAQIVDLRKRNAELLESVEKFKEDTGFLIKKSKELSKPKLPKALEEKIRELSGN